MLIALVLSSYTCVSSVITMQEFVWSRETLWQTEYYGDCMAGLQDLSLQD